MSDLPDPTADDNYMYGGHKLQAKALSRPRTLPRSYREQASMIQPSPKPRPKPRPRRHASGERPLAREVARQEEEMNIAASSEQPAETGQAILLHNVEGTKYEGGIESAAKKYFPGSAPPPTVNVINGELLTGCKVKGHPYNYRLHRDPNTYLVCEQDVVAPLCPEGFLLLEAIKNCVDRLETFRHRLEWGLSLKEGSRVAVTTSGFRYSMINVPAIVHYKGQRGKFPGTFFGIEVLDEIHRKARTSFKDSDGTFQGQRYFTCDTGSGVFVTLQQISPMVETKGRRGSSADKPPMRGRSQTLSAGILTLNMGGLSGVVKSEEASNRSHHDKLFSELKEKQAGTSLLHEGNEVVQCNQAQHPRAPSHDYDEPANFLGAYHMEHVAEGTGASQNVVSSKYPDPGWRPNHIYDEPNQLPDAHHEGHRGAEDPPAHDAGYSQHPQIQQPHAAEDLFMPHDQGVEQPAYHSDHCKLGHATSFSKQPSSITHEYSPQSSVAKQVSGCLLDQQPPQHIQQDFSPGQNQIIPSAARDDPRSELSNEYRTGKVYDLASVSQSAHGPPPPDADRRVYPPTLGRAASTGPPEESHDLVVRSLIQLPAADGTLKYGTIMWIGFAPNVPGSLAGIELEEPMDGCTDGTYEATGQKFFNCPRNMGIYYPLRDLRPDQRWAPDSEGSVDQSGQSNTYPSNHPGRKYGRGQAGVSQSAQGPPPGAHRPLPGTYGQGVVLPAGIAATSSPPGEEAHGLEVGSLIQLPAMDGSVIYGTIKWIGMMPNTYGQIAGIELEEPMEGCTDGTYQATGQKFFNCPYGMGLYYPLENLVPDQRWAPEVPVDLNRLAQGPGAHEPGQGVLPAAASIGPTGEGDISHDLGVGSLIQIPAADGSVMYGTIKWIGLVPNAQGKVAGIELDESIEGCTDGTLKATGQKFFSCSPGKGLYYPMSNLAAVDVHHLKQLYMQLKKENASPSQQNAHLQAESVRVRREFGQRINELTNTLLEVQPFSSKAELNTVSRAELSMIPKKRIGVGAWGEVYSARFRGEDVAIKIAHRDILHQSTVDMLKREIEIMSSVQHPNLVRFIAAVVDDTVERKVDTPIIVSELMDMNLRVAYEHKLDLSDSLISIFRDVAYALHYLHQHHEPIIHRDISAPNVLLKSLPGGSYRAKVSDFGSANLVKNSRTAGAGAIVYCAPEMFPSVDISVPPQPQTTKVDVFSYGMLLLEVISKEMPTHQTRYFLLQKMERDWDVMHALILHCTKPSPSNRPAMADILNKLNSMPY